MFTLVERLHRKGWTKPSISVIIGRVFQRLNLLTSITIDNCIPYKSSQNKLAVFITMSIVTSIFRTTNYYSPLLIITISYKILETYDNEILPNF